MRFPFAVAAFRAVNRGSNADDIVDGDVAARQEMELCRQMGFVRDKVRMFRSGISRANIRYCIVRGMNSGRQQIEFLTGCCGVGRAER